MANDNNLLPIILLGGGIAAGVLVFSRLKGPKGPPGTISKDQAESLALGIIQDQLPTGDSIESIGPSRLFEGKPSGFSESSWTGLVDPDGFHWFVQSEISSPPFPNLFSVLQMRFDGSEPTVDGGYLIWAGTLGDLGL